jgi:hypothetical protein
MDPTDGLLGGVHPMDRYRHVGGRGIATSRPRRHCADSPPPLPSPFGQQPLGRTGDNTVWANAPRTTGTTGQAAARSCFDL